MIRTYAWYGVGRIVGIAQRIEALVAPLDLVAACRRVRPRLTSSLRPAPGGNLLESSSGTWCSWPGPTTRSTYGARSKISCWSFWAMQPSTPMILLGMLPLGVLQPARARCRSCLRRAAGRCRC